MRKLLLTTVFGMMVVAAGGVGCDKNKSAGASSGDAPKKMSADECAMCPGVQSASTNGTCPKCGMKVKG